MSDLTGTQASAQIEAARQQQLDDFRKNAAFSALTQTYGPSAGDPEAWDQAQAANASALETPGKVQAQDLENQQTARTQQQQNLYRASQLYSSTLGPDGSGDPAAYDKLFGNPLVQQATGLSADQIAQAKPIFTGPGAKDRLQQFQKAMIGPQPLTGAFSYGTDQNGQSVAIGHDKFGNPIVQPLNGVTPTAVQNAQSGAANRASLEQNRAVLPNGQPNPAYISAKKQVADNAARAGVTLTQAGLDLATQQFLATGQTAAFGQGGSKNRVAVMNNAAAQGATGQGLANAAQNYKSAQAYETDLSKSSPTSAGGLARSAGAVFQHIDTLDQMIGALQNGNIQLVNNLQQKFKAETGKAAPVTFNAQKTIVGDELTRYLIARGGTAKDRDEMQAGLARANSPAQLQAVIHTYRDDIGAQLYSQYSQAKGFGKEKQFLGILTPEARFILTGVAEPSLKPSAAVQGHAAKNNGGWSIQRVQ